MNSVMVTGDVVNVEQIVCMGTSLKWHRWECPREQTDSHNVST